MKKTAITILLVAIQLISFGQSKVLERVKMNSKILGGDVTYSVYLPADYATSQRAYPVTYLLHGYSGDDADWIQFGQIDRLADKAIAEGKIAPMIIIMPDGNNDFYINNASGTVKYDDFFVNELIPTVEKTYRIKTDKTYRGICGLSMGGYGSMIMALKHPDLFSATAPLSAAFFEDNDITKMDDNWYKVSIGPIFGKDLKGKDRLTPLHYANNIHTLIEKTNVDDLKKVRYYIDCGDDDFLINGNMAAHKALKDKGVPHEFRVKDGGHTWDYWRGSVIDALAFISKSFTQ